MVQDPANSKKHGKAGFDALWRNILTFFDRKKTD